MEPVESSIKKEREKVEKQLANAIREHTNAFHGNSLFPTSSSKKQIIVDEKKAVMDMWKDKMYEAVSLNLPLLIIVRIFNRRKAIFRIKILISKWRAKLVQLFLV